MKKTGMIIFFILLVPIALAESIEINNYSLPSEDAGCGIGDGCNLNCLDGDFDCTCNSQRGYLCNENEACEGALLKSWDQRVCCTIRCEKTINIDGLSNVFNEDNNSANLTGNFEKTEYSFFVIIGSLLIVLIYFVLLELYLMKKEISSITKNELENFEKVGKKEFETLKNKFKKQDRFKLNKNKKLQTTSSLLSNIMDTLNKDEKKVLLRIVEREGLEKEELKAILGFSKDKLDYLLLKLNRRGIIKLKNDKMNPNIYISDWLK